MKGRPSKPVTIEQPKLNEDLVRQDLAVSDKEIQRVARIDAVWGDGDSFDEDRLVHKGLGIVQSTGAGLFELGRIVIWLKERLPHGRYLAAIDRMKISRSLAWKCAQAALRLAGPNVSAPKHLVALGSTKLLELLALDDDQLEELQEEGSVSGVTIDDIDRMSAREARETVRRLRAEKQRDLEIHERVLKQKNDKIDEYEKRLARRDSASKEEREQALIDELWKATGDVGMPLLQVERTLAAIGEMEASENISPALDLARGQALAFLMQAIVDMRARHAIDVDLEERVTPPWMREAA
jgi:hypothetical protein